MFGTYLPTQLRAIAELVPILYYRTSVDVPQGQFYQYPLENCQIVALINPADLEEFLIQCQVEGMVAAHLGYELKGS